MVDVLGWGILGTARINEALIPALQASNRSRLIGVASRELDRAKAYANRWSIPKAYGSYAELLADPQIEAVYISLPNSLHAEWTIKAAQARKAVLCEKPLAITMEEVDTIRQAAQVNGVVVQEAFMYRHIPQTMKVQEIIHSGRLGRIWLVRGSFRYTLRRPKDVRLVYELGGGCLWDVGCYPLSYARMVIESEPDQVFGWQLLSDQGIDLSFAGQLNFPGQCVAQIDSSFASEPKGYMEIVGTEGSLTVPNPFNPKIPTEIHIRRGTLEEIISFPLFDLYSGEVENMAEAVIDGKPQRVSLEDSRANVKAILALLKSAQTGKEVNLGGENAQHVA